MTKRDHRRSFVSCKGYLILICGAFRIINQAAYIKFIPSTIIFIKGKRLGDDDTHLSGHWDSAGLHEGHTGMGQMAFANQETNHKTLLNSRPTQQSSNACVCRVSSHPFQTSRRPCDELPTDKGIQQRFHMTCARVRRRSQPPEDAKSMLHLPLGVFLFKVTNTA